MHCHLLVVLLAACAWSYKLDLLQDNEVEAGKLDQFGEIQDEGWYLWKQAHTRSYGDIGEEKVRYTIWRENLRKITEHNKLGKSYSLRINHLGDLTNQEFKQRNGLLKRDQKRPRGSTFLRAANTVLPEKCDWRKNGAVTPVKNQGQCGSCWAFSTTGSLEGQHFRLTGILINLSEENLVDCSTEFGNHGCNGGLMDNAFRYIKQNGGLDTEESYPYTGKEEECKFNNETVGATDTGFVDIKEGDEEDLKHALATIGPVSVAIDASHFSFQFFHQGVYDEPECSPEQLDHGVLVVGYGVMHGSGGKTEKPYWWVKNSWGTGWGIEGYIRMSRNKDNQCGIASAASYPLV